MSSDARTRDVLRTFDGITWTGVALVVEGLDRHNAVEFLAGLVAFVVAGVYMQVVTDRAMRGKDD